MILLIADAALGSCGLLEQMPSVKAVVVLGVFWGGSERSLVSPLMSGCEGSLRDGVLCVVVV